MKKNKTINLLIKILFALFCILGVGLSSPNTVRAGTRAYLVNGNTFHKRMNEAIIKAKEQDGEINIPENVLNDVKDIQFECLQASSKAEIDLILAGIPWKTLSISTSGEDPSGGVPGNQNIIGYYDNTNKVFVIYICIGSDGLGTKTITFNKDCGGMFEGLSNVNSFLYDPMSGIQFDLSEVVNTSAMFKDCLNLGNVSFFSSSFLIDASKPIRPCMMQYMFKNSGVETVDLSGIDTSAMQATYKNGIARMFEDANEINEITLGPLWNFVSKTDISGVWLYTPTGNSYDASVLESEWDIIANNAGGTIKKIDSPANRLKTRDLYEANGDHINNIWGISDSSYKFTAYCIDKNMEDPLISFTPGSGSPHGYYARIPDDNVSSLLKAGIFTSQDPSYNFLPHYQEYLDCSTGFLNSENYYKGGNQVLGAQTLREALTTVLYYGAQDGLGFQDIQNYIWALTNTYPDGTTFPSHWNYNNIKGQVKLELYQSLEGTQNLVSLKFANFSKVNEAGAKLKGAKMEIQNTSGGVLYSWTTTETDDFSFSLEKGDYYLCEKQAPEGYIKPSSTIPFTIEKNGLIKNGAGTALTYELENVLKLYEVTIKKWNADMSRTLPGAEFGLTGTLLDGRPYNYTKVISLLEGNTLTLNPGFYTLTEEKAPAGFSPLLYPIEFIVKTDGSLYVDSQPATEIDIINYQNYNVTFSKRTLVGSDELPNAHMRLDALGSSGMYTTIKEWVTEETAKTFSLEPGTYKFIEDAAPNGYLVHNEINFVLRNNGSIAVEGVNITDRTIIMKDELKSYDVKFRKTNGTDPLSGADLTVIGTNLENITKEWAWISDGTDKTLSLKPGTYRYIETSAPSGYQVSETIVFTVTLNGDISINSNTSSSRIVTMVDEKINDEYIVKFKKVNTLGKYLSDAKLYVEGTTKGGENYKSSVWTSGTETHSLKLKPGSYRFIESSAPDGYNLADTIPFVVKSDGTVESSVIAIKDKTIIMKDEMKVFPIRFSKKDEKNNHLIGAKLHVSGVTDEGNAVTISPWVSNGKEHVELLKPGAYYLTETEAPPGYDLTSPEMFFVSAMGNVYFKDKVTFPENQEVVIVNKKTVSPNTVYKVTINKVTSDRIPLSGASLSVTGETSGGEKFNEISWTTNGSPVVLELKPGRYILTEKQAPEGYNITNAILFTINGDGKVYVNGMDMNANISMIDYKKEEPQGDNVVSNYYSNQAPSSGVASAIVPTTSITVIKQNMAGVKLADAQLAIYSSVDATLPVASWLTVSNETFSTPLVPGAYVLKEIKAPSGYSLAQDMPFIINEKGELIINGITVPTKTLIMIDGLVTGEIPKNIKTGEEGITPTILFFLTIPFLLLYGYRNKKINNKLY